MTKTRNPAFEMVVVHLQGAISTRDFVSLFEERLHREGRVGGVRILFDWCALSQWKLEDWPVLGGRRWSVATRSIDRIAIVHHAAWKRQAAMFAAILRRENVVVRSWKPERIQDAVAWLESDA